MRDIGNAQGALRKMFVHPDYRGSQHGVARALLNRLLEESRNRGDGTGAPSFVTLIGGSVLLAAMTVESPANAISMRPTFPGAITSAT